jgi:uncharacterized protein YbdZ (MbtH family)
MTRGPIFFLRNFTEIPVHCASVREPDTTQACLDFINQIGPTCVPELIESMNAASKADRKS